MTIICFGDSNTYGFDPRSFWGDRYHSENRWVDILRNYDGWFVSNEGQNGRIVPMRWDYLADNFDLLIVMLGTNDLLQGRSADFITERMKLFLLSLGVDENKILLVAPPKLQWGEWVTDNALIAESIRLSHTYSDLARKYGFYFVDAQQWEIELAYDGVHFTERGHATFAEKIYKYIKSEIINNCGV